LLIWAGVAAVVVYVLGDLAATTTYGGYSSRDQAISELSAFGSPVRPLMMTVILTHSVLLIAYGAGVFRAADRDSLRWVGALLIVASLVTLPTHTIWAMSSRGTAAGFNDTMHMVTTAAFAFLIAVAVLLSAIAFRGWFRLFAVVVLVLLIGFGSAASVAMGDLGANDTPWAGAFERINAYSYFAWIVALAVVLMQKK
jgi:hypothetical membrane protein